MMIFPHPVRGEDTGNFQIKILKWPGGKEAAVSLRFDDGLESHVRTVIPLLNAYDFSATFLVNPGKGQFKKHKTFWTEEVPKHGHRLGNHTMNHRGASSLEQAEYEIGEPAHLIRKLYPDQSPLMVFASGGGEKWGGKYWDKADIKYKSLVAKYQMIDLYDGNHPYISAYSSQTAGTLAKSLEKTLFEGRHQTITFHHVGGDRIKDILKGVLFNSNNAFPTHEFERFLKILHAQREKLWIAPLIETIKYEKEIGSAAISDITDGKNSINFKLEIGTDPVIYDIPLTVIVKGIEFSLEKAQQDGEIIPFHVTEDSVMLWLKPTSSEILISFKTPEVP